MRYLFVVLAALLSTGAIAGTFYPTKDRTVPIVGVIDKEALQVSDEILKLADGSGKDIDLIIQSPGGSIAIGRVIIQSIKIAKRRGHTVRCAVVSYAASMAFSVLANCSERYALEEAQMLYHPPRLSVFAATITPKIAAQLADELKKVNLEIIQELQELYPVPLHPFLRHYIRESWHSAKDLNADLGGNATWITAVDDIEGITSLVSENPGEYLPAASGQIIYQFLPNR